MSLNSFVDILDYIPIFLLGFLLVEKNNFSNHVIHFSCKMVIMIIVVIIFIFCCKSKYNDIAIYIAIISFLILTSIRKNFQSKKY